MNTLRIPQDLFATSSSIQNEGVYVINYQSKATEIVRSKIVLQQHLFSMLVEGHKSVHTAHKHLQINNNQFLLLTSGHYLMTEKMISDAGAYQSILFFFTQQSLTDFFSKHSDAAKCVQSATAIPEQVYAFDKDAFLTNFIQSLIEISSGNARMPQSFYEVKLQELLLYMCHQYPQQMQSVYALASRSEAETEIKQLAENHIESNITVEELAFLCNMSLSTFKRKFLKIYGIPPSKWFLQKRLEHAASLLKMGNMKPAEVYYKVGYENHSSFTHSFKQVFGITPSEYASQTL
ncbi:AraC-type DNA-binding protein [Filimonas lacunae]|uniref:AraC-type DNA-binding protein n=1 Tax=Filimonas lacunae TaxID=477680 RepID=A0A173MPC1_9BACT|nr:AraC family transcriptional regulator [Filimonas lacunae]BAV09525.1 transcriptional regulator, AraC family [Filimonas lacunae]SIS74640.1 AraC-type DNA-binding protein [Filimonas lacunae]